MPEPTFDQNSFLAGFIVGRILSGGYPVGSIEAPEEVQRGQPPETEESET